MDEEKEKWMENVLNSMSGSQRAKPRPELLKKIQSKIGASETKVVPLRQWKYAVAAAILILLMNTITWVYVNQPNPIRNESVTVVDTYNQTLIRSFQIYE